MEIIKLKNILKELFLKEDKKWKEYTIPKDKKLLLYDFYVLSYLSTLNLKNIDVSKSGGSFVGRTSEELKRNILEVEKKLFPYLKKDLLNTVFFAICAEIRHIHDQLEDPRQEWDNLKDNKIYTTYQQLYQNKHVDIASKFRKHYSDTIPNKHAYSKRMANYYIVHELMKKLNLSEYDFVNFCKKMFLDLDWKVLYGGTSWANICDGWIDLYNTSENDLNKLQIQIDHIYDLEHNSGTVFDKKRSYFKQSKQATETGYGWDTTGDGYEWIKKALNLKRDAKSMYNLLPHCSSQMKKLALEAFKRAGVKSESEMYKENIRKKLDKNGVFDDNLRLDSDLKIKSLREVLPKELKVVNGYFICSNIETLKSLDGIQGIEFKQMFGGILCNLSNIQALKEAKVSDIYLNNNKLESLEGCPETINGTLDVDDNPLKSFKGSPKIINGTFSIRRSTATDLENLPKKINKLIYTDSSLSEKYSKEEILKHSDIKYLDDFSY